MLFCFHMPFFFILSGFLMNGTIWMAFAIATTAMLILSGLAWLSRKYCPILIGK